MNKAKVSLKTTGTKKIDSPLAQYSSAGQLYCVLCNAVVKNEMYWTGHINGKAHREQLFSLKNNKSKRIADEANSSSPAKKSKYEDGGLMAPPPPPPPLKKYSLVKHVASEVQDINQPSSTVSFGENYSKKDQESDLFVESQPVETKSSQLPEGFFDDPKEDAKARGMEYRNPEEVEWEKFVKEIASEDIKSTVMRSIDEEESTRSRELEEIEEQMAHWQRVINLEKKAQDTKQQINRQDPNSRHNDEEEFDEEIEYDEELDWRSKRH